MSASVINELKCLFKKLKGYSEDDPLYVNVVNQVDLGNLESKLSDIAVAVANIDEDTTAVLTALGELNTLMTESNVKADSALAKIDEVKALLTDINADTTLINTKLDGLQTELEAIKGLLNPVQRTSHHKLVDGTSFTLPAYTSATVTVVDGTVDIITGTSTQTFPIVGSVTTVTTTSWDDDAVFSNKIEVDATNGKAYVSWVGE